MAIVDDGKDAVTHFNVLEHFKDYTLIECELETGRTSNSCAHEIYRFPLVGDPKYGPKKTLDIGGQALHAGVIDSNIQSLMNTLKEVQNYQKNLKIY